MAKGSSRSTADVGQIKALIVSERHLRLRRRRWCPRWASAAPTSTTPSIVRPWPRNATERDVERLPTPGEQARADWENVWSQALAGSNPPSSALTGTKAGPYARDSTLRSAAGRVSDREGIWHPPCDHVDDPTSESDGMIGVALVEAADQRDIDGRADAVGPGGADEHRE